MSSEFTEEEIRDYADVVSAMSGETLSHQLEGAHAVLILMGKSLVGEGNAELMGKVLSAVSHVSGLKRARSREISEETSL